MQLSAWNVTMGNCCFFHMEIYLQKVQRFMHLVQTKHMTTMMWPETVSHIYDILLFEGSEQL